jgi:uncharacterized tellurite resistance protein B-like protein
MHEQNMAILKGLVSVAWADGRVAAEEMEVLEGLLQAFEATPSEAQELRVYAKLERSLHDIPLNDLSYDDRRVLLQHAVLLTFVDGEQHEKERRLLDELCRTLHIPDAEAKTLISAAEQRSRELVALLSAEAAEKRRAGE